MWVCWTCNVKCLFAGVGTSHSKHKLQSYSDWTVDFSRTRWQKLYLNSYENKPKKGTLSSIDQPYKSTSGCRLVHVTVIGNSKFLKRISFFTSTVISEELFREVIKWRYIHLCLYVYFLYLYLYLRNVVWCGSLFSILLHGLFLGFNAGLPAYESWLRTIELLEASWTFFILFFVVFIIVFYYVYICSYTVYRYTDIVE